MQFIVFKNVTPQSFILRLSGLNPSIYLLYFTLVTLQINVALRYVITSPPTIPILVETLKARHKVWPTEACI